jgi:hypothetical protein
MADEKIIFGLDLDSKDFQSKLSNALGMLEKIGDPKNFANFASSVLKVTALVSSLSLAFVYLKSKFEDVLEAEKINAINKEFELLTANAGISGDALRDAFIKSTGGTIAAHESIQLANDAIIRMGKSAERIPEIMVLAKKAAMLTGQTSAQAFSNLTMAISVGNQRMLRQYGLTVDVDRVTKAYAASLGTTSDLLSEAGKKHAILNEVLLKGENKFKGISGELMPVTTETKKLAVSISELGEIITMVSARNFAPAISMITVLLTKMANDARYYFAQIFGDSKEKVEADADYIAQSIERINKAIAMNKNRQLSEGNMFGLGKFTAEQKKYVTDYYDRQLTETLWAQGEMAALRNKKIYPMAIKNFLPKMK